MPPCADFDDFKDWLIKTRKEHDNILFALNKTDGTPQNCSPIWDALWKNSRQREENINKCVEYYENALQNINESARDYLTLKKRCSFLKSERDIEEILRDKAEQDFKRKCRGFKPPLTNT